MNGVELIAEERERQIEKEGWTAKHDDSFNEIGRLSMAGACYAAFSMVRNKDNPPPVWPLGKEHWKPSPSALRNLAKAGALIAAEMDRLMRMDEQPRTEE